MQPVCAFNLRSIYSISKQQHCVVQKNICILQEDPGFIWAHM